MIMIFAPDGIGEVGADAALAQMIITAVRADQGGPLRDGDILVVTSKIISKAEGRSAPAAEREAMITAEAVSTVAQRGPLRIVRTRTGLVQAAAGVDNSNVSAELILLLPADADASAARLRAELQALTGLRLGVIISDTAGRAWRMGQTDHAIGASGVRVIERYAGRTDAYGNPLLVTEMALADELAAAADLVKGKLAGRPVAVVRGRSDLLTDEPETATDLVRDAGSDFFRYGSREAVLVALLAATGQAERFEALAGLSDDELAAAVLERCDPADATLVERILRSA
jgi:coenzyme F420-0:L-glutamate ligase / coenzyme F420-1:gamma-L-glutamate ligase